jgi:hypothetical protein
MQKVACTLLLLSLFCACTIEKRVFLPGYSIHWNKKLVVANKHCISSEEKSDELIGTQQEAAKTPLLEKISPEADTIVQQDSLLTYNMPQGFVKKEVHQPKQVIKRPVIEFGYRADGPEQEITTKPAKDWQILIAVLLGIASGLGLYLLGLILLAILFHGRKSELAVANRKPEHQKTFRWIFLASFLITLMLFLVLGFSTLFVLLALSISYYGLAWIIAILMVLLALLIWLAIKALFQTLHFLYPFRETKKTMN